MKKMIRATQLVVLGIAVLLIAGRQAQGGRLYAVQEGGGGPDRLVTIDTDSFDITDVGALGVPYNFGGLAYDPNSDTLYLVDGRESRSLFTVDRNTGAATLVGTHDVRDLFGLAFDSANNVLYGSQDLGSASSNAELFALNTGSGAATSIGTVGRGLDGLAYDSLNDRLVGIDPAQGDLYEVDRTDGSRTLLLDGDFVNNSGLTYDPDKNLFWDVDHSGNLFSYDPTDGFARTTHLSGLGAHNGLAYLTSALPPSTSPVPEPASFALLGIGLVGTGLSAARRRRERSRG